MIFNTKLVLLSFVALVAAQGSSTGSASGSASASGSGSRSASGTASSTASAAIPSASGLDDCILGCVTPAATDAGCGSFANLTCVCTSSRFQSAALACLQANCTSADQQNALTLQQSECAAIVGGASGSGSATGSGRSSAAAPTVTTPSGGSPSGSAPAAATTSNAASFLTSNSIWGLAAGVAGAAAAVAL